MTPKTAADWCSESLAHDVVVLEERAIRAEHDVTVWRDLAHVALHKLWTAQAENERLTWELLPQIPEDLDRNDDR